jgi:hypothetical protein
MIYANYFGQWCTVWCAGQSTFSEAHKRGGVKSVKDVKKKGLEMNRKKGRGSIHNLYIFRPNSFNLAARVLR